MEYRIPPGVEAVEKLEDFIVVNRLAPNTRIPSERDLCEMWGVSRSTLRQAVDALVCRGVLYRISGSGVYVSGGKKNRNMVSRVLFWLKKLFPAEKWKQPNRFQRNCEYR